MILSAIAQTPSFDPSVRVRNPGSYQLALGPLDVPEPADHRGLGATLADRVAEEDQLAPVLLERVDVGLGALDQRDLSDRPPCHRRRGRDRQAKPLAQSAASATATLLLRLRRCPFRMADRDYLVELGVAHVASIKALATATAVFAADPSIIRSCSRSH